MSATHPLRCYDYVNHPFARVREAVHENASEIFKLATTSASERQRDIGVQLRVRVGALEIGTEVLVQVGPVHDTMSSPLGYEVAEFPLEWTSTKNPSLFPHMKAKLSVYPLSSTETQLELEGTYDPPLGVLGDAIDAVVGKRIAEATVLRFLQDVAAQLRTRLATPKTPS
jgi:hypothetical protein